VNTYVTYAFPDDIGCDGWRSRSRVEAYILHVLRVCITMGRVETYRCEDGRAVEKIW